MTDPDPGEEATLFPKTAGERLREAREAQGLSLAEVAARTRVPIRQLEAVETSNFAALPSVTYAVGFARAYARAVGADEVAIAREVRAQNEQMVRRTEYEAYEISETRRLPTGGLALTGVAIAALLLVAIGLWYGTNLFRGEDAPTAAVTPVDAPADDQPVVPPPASVVAQVTLVANDEVWMKIYDAKGATLFQNTLKPGERYDVPTDADAPMINVGRPDQLQVLVNGSAVPPLGDGRVAIMDVGVSAAALAARGTSVPGPVASPGGRASSRARAPQPRSAPNPAAPLNIAAPAPLPPSEQAPAPASTPAP